MASGERFIKKSAINMLLKGLFFNTIISLSMEGLLDFIVCSFLNIYTVDFSINGEILGFIISLFCSFCTIIFVPLAFIWAILTKDEAQLASKDF